MSTAGLLRLLGALLLAASGTGGGVAVYLHYRAAWQQVHTFAALLRYLQEQMRYRPLPARQLLQRAARRPELAALALGQYTVLGQLPPPPCLDAALRLEWQETLAALDTAPRQAAAESLSYLARQCAAAAEEKHRQAQEVRRLWPRLGACLGAMAAILFL